MILYTKCYPQEKEEQKKNWGWGRRQGNTHGRFGRTYEDSIYQWMPTDAVLMKDGKMKFDSYINGLDTDKVKDKQMYDMLENLLTLELPYIEAVWRYVEQFEYNDGNYHGDETKKEQPSGAGFAEGKRLQVIPKIVDYLLQPGESYEGVWHVEGMSHEHVVATTLLIMQRDKALEGGNLQFKRAFTKSEGSFLAHSYFPQDAHRREPVS
eukprot:UN24649